MSLKPVRSASGRTWVMMVLTFFAASLLILTMARSDSPVYSSQPPPQLAVMGDESGLPADIGALDDSSATIGDEASVSMTTTATATAWSTLDASTADLSGGSGAYAANVAIVNDYQWNTSADDGALSVYDLKTMSANATGESSIGYADNHGYFADLSDGSGLLAASTQFYYDDAPAGLTAIVPRADLRATADISADPTAGNSGYIDAFATAASSTALESSTRASLPMTNGLMTTGDDTSTSTTRASPLTSLGETSIWIAAIIIAVALAPPAVYLMYLIGQHRSGARSFRRLIGKIGRVALIPTLTTAGWIVTTILPAPRRAVWAPI